MNKQNLLLYELKNQLTALHYMGMAHGNFKLYCEYGESVTNYIESKKMDIILYIDSWINPIWQSAEGVYSEFFRLYNEGEELEALRVLNIK